MSNLNVIQELLFDRRERRETQRQERVHAETRRGGAATANRLRRRCAARIWGWWERGPEGSAKATSPHAVALQFHRSGRYSEATPTFERRIHTAHSCQSARQTRSTGPTVTISSIDKSPVLYEPVCRALATIRCIMHPPVLTHPSCRRHGTARTNEPTLSRSRRSRHRRRRRPTYREDRTSRREARARSR